MTQFLVHTETKREFEVVNFDSAAGTITLRGPNTKFTEPFDKERFKANGYTLVNRDVPPTPDTEDAPAPKTVAATAKMTRVPPKAKPAPEEDEEDEDAGED